MTFVDCLQFVLSQEGGWSDNPLDAGGCTFAGVILPVYQAWTGNPNLTCGDLQLITPSDVAQIYLDLYWTPIQGDALPGGVNLMIMDMAVNAGVHGSTVILQQVLGVAVDGALGVHTIAAIAGRNDIQLVIALGIAQTAFYCSRKSFGTFGVGWLRRVAARQLAAINALTKPPPVVTLPIV